LIRNLTILRIAIKHTTSIARRYDIINN
jgi:hypothetical protein